MKRAIACTLPLSLSACNLYFHSADQDAAPIDAPADATPDAAPPQDPSQRCRAALFVATADQVQTWRSEIDPTRAPFNRIARFATGAGESDQQRTLWGDVNGDGLSDLVIATSAVAPARAQTFLQQANGSFAAGITSQLDDGGTTLRLGANIVYATLLADATGDGKADLIVVDPTATMRIRLYRATTTGMFDAMPLGSDDASIGDAGVTSTEKTLTGDVDGDGDIDVVHVNAATRHVHAYLNAGNGTFGNSVLTENFMPGAVVDSNRDIHLADVNGDRRADLVYGHQDSNPGLDTYAASATQPGRFAIASMHSAVTGIDAGHAGDETSEVIDWNGDGFVDWVFAFQGERRIALGLGDGTFAPTAVAVTLAADTLEASAPVVGFSGSRASGIGFASADRDGDGLADCRDTDADGDGINNLDEDRNHNGDLSDDDDDRDGAPNYLDAIVRAPGGVGQNLAFWVNGSDRLNVNGNGDVLTWESLAGEPMQQVQRGPRETLSASPINGYPAVNFAGSLNGPTGWFFQRWLESLSPFAERGKWTQFAVTNKNTLDGNYLFTTGKGCGFDRFLGHWVHGDGVGGIWAFDGFNAEVVASANPQFATNRAMLAISARLPDDTFAMYDEGGLTAQSRVRNITIGADVGFYQMTRCGSQAHAGDLAEQIIYRSELTVAQRGQVASYLAMKYGLQLPMGQSYVSSDPAIVVWNATSGDGLTYDHHITIIGRDDISGLRQTASRSQAPGAHISLALQPPLEWGTDRTFIALGDDDGATSFSIGDAPNGFKRQTRTFRVAMTGLAQNNVRLTIPRSVFPTLPDTQTLAVLVSTSTVFASATSYPMTLIANAYSIDLPLHDGELLALAINQL